MPLTVLLVANDKTATTEYANCFSKKEFSTLAAHSGRQALKEAKSNNLDAIVLDLTSPRLNCKTLCRKLKSASFAPLVLITSPNAKVDSALNAAGAVPKPAVAKRLASRVKTAIESKPPRLLTVGKLALDLEKHKLTRGNKTFPLTPKEFGLLKTLMEHAGQLVTRKVLIRQVWETDYMGDTRTLDVHVRWVREKVEDDPGEPKRLKTVRGEGYKIEKESA
ncbi:MAG: response regulator transcription factor [Chloroflexi bacterium]|nr:response regulator transcription factor [Chloroflexota bacterium]